MTEPDSKSSKFIDITKKGDRTAVSSIVLEDSANPLSNN